MWNMHSWQKVQGNCTHAFCMTGLLGSSYYACPWTCQHYLQCTDYSCPCCPEWLLHHCNRDVRDFFMLKQKFVSWYEVACVKKWWISSESLTVIHMGGRVTLFARSPEHINILTPTSFQFLCCHSPVQGIVCIEASFIVFSQCKPSHCLPWITLEAINQASSRILHINHERWCYIHPTSLLTIKTFFCWDPIGSLTMTQISNDRLVACMCSAPKNLLDIHRAA